MHLTERQQSMLHTVLVVEDDDFAQSMISRKLARAGIDAVSATTLEDAMKIIEERLEEFSGILMDGCLQDDYPDTKPLIVTIMQSRFTGPLIAMSGLREYRDVMVTWGCTHQADKYDAADLVRQLLAD